MNFVLPPRSQVGYLDSEIAREGQKVDSNGREFWEDDAERPLEVPAPKSIFPDWSKIKPIAKYFAPYVFRPFPTWVYHPTEEPRKAKDKYEAAKLGIVYRQATEEERAKYHAPPAFYDCVGDWTVNAFPKDRAFNPKKLGNGKTLIRDTPDPMRMQTELMQTIAAGQTPDPKLRIELEELRKTVETMQALLSPVKEAPITQEELGVAEELERQIEEKEMELAQFSEYEALKLLATSKGIKVDGRWSESRLKEEIEKVS